MSNFISRGVKSVRKALHLPPITLGNIATKYAPAGIMAATGNPMGAAATMYGGAAIPQPKPISINPNGFSQPGPTMGGTAPAAAGGGNWWDPIVSGVTNAAKSAGSYVKNNPLDAGILALATAQGVNSAKASAKSGAYSDEAVKLAKDRWASQAPLRSQGMSGLLNKTTHDLSSVYSDPQNPFSSVRKALPAAGPPKVPPKPTPVLPIVPKGGMPSAPVTLPGTSMPTSRTPQPALPPANVVQALQRLRKPLRTPSAQVRV